MFTVVYRCLPGKLWGCDPKMITRTSRSWDGWFGCKNFVRKKSTTSAFPRESGASRWTEVNGVLGTTQKMLLDVGWSWGFIRLYNALLFHLYFWKKKAHHKRMWFQCWAWFISPLDTQEAGQAHQQGMAIAVDTAVAVVPSYSKLWRKWKRISMSSSDWRRPTLWSSDGFD